jgi:hypothetical protein
VEAEFSAWGELRAGGLLPPHLFLQAISKLIIPLDRLRSSAHLTQEPMDSSDAPNMQSYPSPGAVAADANGPFYSTSSNAQQTGLSHSDDLAELQRDLAPIMHAGQSGSLSDGQDLRNQGTMNHHHYENENHTASHMQARQAMEEMGDQYGTPDGTMAPRKRSKVSRACDECRRKKIRCDATGDEGKEQCSNCKRVGSRCQFSRVPMKRGPSKGYATPKPFSRAS